MKKISLHPNIKKKKHASLSDLRKLYFDLEGPEDIDRLLKIQKICDEYRKLGNSRLAAEVTLKFIYDQSSYYLEGMIVVVDRLLSHVKPIPASEYFGQDNYMKWFSRHLRNIFIYTFKSNNARAQLVAERCLESWYKNKLISDVQYREIRTGYKK